MKSFRRKKKKEPNPFSAVMVIDGEIVSWHDLLEELLKEEEE